ncbi:MAG: hypothetical protein WC455_07250 [Dehalococcoidia bacterium]|jgi:hypothetical protein
MAQPKKRYTGQFWNAVGDHLWAYLEKGWRDPKDAAKMAGAFAQAAADINCDEWVAFCVPYENETSFTKFLERRIKESDIPADYFVIRAKSATDDKVIDSWYFIYGLTLNVISAKSNRYSSHAPELIDVKRLVQMIGELLNSAMHPELPGHRLNRWNASQKMRQFLASNRAKHLVKIARGDTSRDFEKALARLMVHDRPFIFGRDKDKKIQILRDTGMLNDDEITKVVECINEWSMVDMYKGPPEVGAKMDEKSGEFNVRETDSYIIADRKKKLTKRQQGFETVYHPTDSDIEEYSDTGQDDSDNRSEEH